MAKDEPPDIGPEGRSKKSTGKKPTRSKPAPRSNGEVIAIGSKAKPSSFAAKKRKKELPQETVLASLLKLPVQDWPTDWFEGERALDILEPFYSAFLDNCVDDDSEVDTRTVMELQAGVLGVFLADYSGFFGEEKTLDLLRRTLSIALRVYVERLAES